MSAFSWLFLAVLGVIMRLWPLFLIAGALLAWVSFRHFPRITIASVIAAIVYGLYLVHK